MLGSIRRGVAEGWEEEEEDVVLTPKRSESLRVVRDRGRAVLEKEDGDAPALALTHWQQQQHEGANSRVSDCS